MALLNKLFFPSSSTTSTPAAATASFKTSLSSPTTTTTLGASVNKQSSNNPVHSKNYLSQFPFDGRQVRVLLYRECDGRRLLFDSNALEKIFLKENNGNVPRDKVNQNQNTQTLGHNNGSKNAKHSNSSGSGFIEACEDYGYKHNRPTSDDIASIGEMVFGASAMSFRGTAFKIHWLHTPSRVLCSQVFLNPVSSSTSGGTSPYSTISMNSLATPRTSISSEHGSIDGLSMNSFSMPFSVSVARHLSLTPSERCPMSTYPVDVPDQQSIVSAMSGDSVRTDSAPRCSSTYSTVTDSGYSGMSRSQISSDQWSASYQYSTRSSLGSVLSDHSDPLRKLSIDSAFFPSSATHFDGVPCDGSLQRRICRNLRTSFENEHSINDLIGFVSDCYSVNSRLNGGSEGGCLGTPNYRRASYCANESRSNPEIGKRRETASKPATRRAKLGLAVLITMSESFEEEMELFCSEHIALLESMLSRLRVCTERAYLNHKEFYQIMFNSWQSTQQWFSDLFTAPRVKCPVWLSITTSGSKYSKSVAESFMKELCWLLSFADTKDTNFFISTMLTAILTHHLGWVATVSAFNASAAISEASAVAIEQRAKLLQVSQKHPYNALWAQMGDLFGAVGMPPKLTRTIIYGTEKLSVERLLKILTYFIRCSEVRRSSKREDFNKELINTIVAQNKNETINKSAYFARTGLKKCNGGNGGVGVGGGGGLMRTQTCIQYLNTISDSFDEVSSSDGSDVENTNIDEAALVPNAKKNEIPTVLAFRDSRFVQQELRIGNYLMDTGIEKSSVLRRSSTGSNGMKDGRIRLTLTTPENIELQVEDDHTTIEGSSISSEDGAVEAIEIDAHESRVRTAATAKENLLSKKQRSSFFWKIVPQSVKDGLSLDATKENEKRLSSMSQSSINRTHLDDESNNCQLKRHFSHLSLSDLITQNSMGKSERMTWGIEPIKENVSLEEQIHFDYCQKLIEREHGITRNVNESVSKSNALSNDVSVKNNNKESLAAVDGVVFVLGDNEPLVNIRKSTEDLTTNSSSSAFNDESSSTLMATTKTNNESNSKQCNEFQKQQLCSLHQRTHGNSAMHSKKHSGVKFNFEEYPQIVTNYMKSKNLVMSNYDLLMEKCSKLELANAMAAQQQQTELETKRALNVSNNALKKTDLQIKTSTTTSIESSTCIICNGILNSYQTPSNATELEFETDEEHSYSTATTTTTTTSNTTSMKPNNSSSSRTLNTVNSATSIDTIKSLPKCETLKEIHSINNSNSNAKTLKDEQTGSQFIENELQSEICNSQPTTTPTIVRRPTYSGKVKKVSSQRGSTSSVAAKCAAAVNEAVHLLKLPIPGIKELPQDDDPPDNMKLRAGFIPSLFLNVSDHYVSDVVLQGTLAPPKKWEIILREDLALSAHSASLISLPVENIAIVADMENWDVRLISSQAQLFSCAGGLNAPVGMSQLVSSMLETVQAMHNAGISAYECLSYLESKLQEIYLQSETLAAFLLETDFCSLSAVTSALNLTENDVPLLLSIASIHTPQISKKCGISFR